MISLLKSKSDFFNSRALFISANKLSVFHWQRGKLGSSYLFDTGETGHQDFKLYLQEWPDTPSYIVVDIVEEEFRQATIPHVFGADRKALIKRKQDRLFRDGIYFYTQNQGREKLGRKDDRLLFMSLSNQAIIDPWLNVLNEHKIPMKGILSAPLLIQSYIKTLPDIADHALFVTMQGISGLRQTFFENKELKLSRLTKLTRYGSVPAPHQVLSEVDKIRRYLNSLFLISNDKPLNIYFIANKAILDEIEKQDESSSVMLRKYFFNIDELLQASGIDKKQDVPFCDQLLMNHLLKEQPENCYAFSHEMHYAKMRTMRHAMNVFGVCLLALACAYSSAGFISTLSYKQQSESARNKTAFYQSRYNIATESLPKMPGDLDSTQIKTAVDAVDVINEYKATPFEMLSFIGKGLEQFPDIRLDDLEWDVTMNPDSGDDAVSNNTHSVVITADNNDEQFKYYQVSTLKARIEPFDGNYREAIATVNNFADALRNNDIAHEIKVESYPLDISSKSTLQGNAKSVAREALFSLTAVIGVN